MEVQDCPFGCLSQGVIISISSAGVVVRVLFQHLVPFMTEKTVGACTTAQDAHGMARNMPLPNSAEFAGLLTGVE